MAGHVHARPTQDTADVNRSPRVAKRRLRAKTSMAKIERLERGRSRVPELPCFRVLHPHPAEVTISEGSMVASTSPRSGSIRAHPYNPVSDAMGSSSCEYVPSVVNRAASDVGFNESIEVTPIPRSISSPSILRNPSQVMRPNLVAGSASIDPPPMREIGTEVGVQATLQQWAEGKTEHGTVERRYTQCAQTWPLASHPKLENMESAIQLLRQACDYLYNGMTQMGSIVDQKCTTEKV